MENKKIKIYSFGALISPISLNNGIMEFINFFKTLNKKIDSYDKMAPKTNPFKMPNYITLVWVDEECPIKDRFNKE